MEISYKKDFHHSYLILQDEEMPNCDSYAVRMLLHGSIPGLLSCTIHRIDNQSLFYYDITSKQTLASLYETQKMDKEMLTLLIGAFVRVVEEMEAFLLNPEEVLLNPEYIYVNPVERKIGFVCWNGEIPERGDFLKLMEYLLPRIDHQDADAVALGYQMYRRAMNQEFDFEKIRQELYRETAKPEPKEESTVFEEGLSQEEILEEVLKHVEEEKPKDSKIKAGISVGCLLVVAVIYWYLVRNQFFSWVLFAVIGSIAVTMLVSAVFIWKIQKKRNSSEDTKDEKSSMIWEQAEEDLEELPNIMDEAQTTLLFAEPEDFSLILKSMKPDEAADIPLQKGVSVIGKLASVVDIVLPSAEFMRKLSGKKNVACLI